MIIYEAYNTKNGKSYIGLTKVSLKSRIQSHKSMAKRGSNYSFHRAIRKHGFDSFEWSVIATTKTYEELKRLETLFISLLEKWQLYNMTEGGEGTSGRKLSEFTKRKISESHADFSGDKNPRWGVTLTEDTKRKISLSLIGREFPEKRNKKKFRFVHDCGEEFHGMKYDFCKKYNLSPPAISAVISGRRKRHKGWHVIYA